MLPSSHVLWMCGKQDYCSAGTLGSRLCEVNDSGRGSQTGDPTIPTATTYLLQGQQHRSEAGDTQLSNCHTETGGVLISGKSLATIRGATLTPPGTEVPRPSSAFCIHWVLAHFMLSHEHIGQGPRIEGDICRLSICFLLQGYYISADADFKAHKMHIWV